MERSDERAADEQVARERNRQNVRDGRERIRELAAGVAATQESLATTLHGMADRARREGRLDDARRLKSEAGAALRGAAHERHEAERPGGPMPGITTGPMPSTAGPR